MQPVLIDLEHLQPGTEPLLITAADPRVIADLPAARTPDGAVVSRWRLTDAERACVFLGADVYLFMRLDPAQAFPPVSLVVGPERRPTPSTGVIS